ncbi:MAG: long-chain fatty acid--CoA ligase [Rhizobiaceae bacterium]|nr:long-chain fatty acid--CoA ligase [Rhizobiaceae bacterium]
MRSTITQGIRRAAQVNPRGIATICADRRRTWVQVTDRVARLAAGLQSLGVAKGDRVAVLSMNTDRYFELYYAIWWAGAVATPMNMRLAPAEIDFRLEDSGAKVLFLDAEHLPLYGQLGSSKAGLSHVVAMEEKADGFITTEELIASNQPAEDAEANGDDLAFIVYTGGSTGRSKGVMLSHENVCQNGLSALYTIGYRQASVYLHAGPMSHLADGMSIFAVTLAAATHVFMPRFTVEECLRLIEAHRITHLCVVPTMVEMIVQGAEGGRHDVSSLEQIQFGSAPMPDGTLKRAVALWPDILFLHGYGMTELSPLITIHPPETRRPDIAGDLLKSAGKAGPNLEVRIVDAEGREVPRGTVGELICRGPTVMRGYWNLPEQTAKAIRNGWMYTEDAAWMDEEGYVYIVDRLKDMIISGGENIYSSEVENALSRIPGVQMAAVVGVPHPLWGEAVHAVIVPQPGAQLSAEFVIAECKKAIASYKCPKTVEFRTTDMPLTSAGKVDKKVLRAEVAGRA